MPFEIDLDIEHNGDWTMLTKEFNVVVQTLDYAVRQINNRYVNIEMSNVRCLLNDACSKDNVDDFLYEMMKNKSVLKLVKLDKKGGNSVNGCNIITIENYDVSIRKLVDEKIGFFTSTRSYANTEHYTIFFPFASHKTIAELRQELKDAGNILSLNIIKNACVPIGFGPCLTKREVEVLRNGWYGGYFNYPKGVKLKKLAADLGITRSTLDFHIRNSVRKSIKYLLDQGIYDWQ